MTAPRQDLKPTSRYIATVDRRAKDELSQGVGLPRQTYFQVLRVDVVEA